MSLKVEPLRTNQDEDRSTKKRSYTDRSLIKQSVWWKRILKVQALYGREIRRLKPGFTLDIGCGLGRNLAHLNGYGVGIDHNPHSVRAARSRRLQAFTPEEFQESKYYISNSFDSILLAHVVEHMTEPEAVNLLVLYLHLLKPGGQVIFITPQEYGYRSDETHIQFMDFETLRNIAGKAGLAHVKEYSFPFPRLFGRVFKYNEFVSISKKIS